MKPVTDLELAMSIISRVCDLSHIPQERLLSRRRDDRTAYWRHVAYWVMRRATHLSYPAIGEIMGRDHSSVLHGVQAIERRMEDHPCREVLGLVLGFSTIAGNPVVHPGMRQCELKAALEAALIVVEAQEMAA